MTSDHINQCFFLLDNWTPRNKIESTPQQFHSIKRAFQKCHLRKSRPICPQPQCVNLTQKQVPYVKEWRLYASMNWVNIGLVNGLPPNGDKPLSKPMFFVLIIEHTGTNLSESLNQQPINFIREKGFSKMLSAKKPDILSPASMCYLNTETVTKVASMCQVN